MQFTFAAPAPPSGYTPYPFQLDAIRAIQAAHARQVRRMLVVMPTGTGKSVVGSQLPAALDCRPMLWLAHRKELLDQARDHLRRANPKLTVDVEQGDRYADHDADIVVASVPTLGRKESRRKEKFKRFGLLLVDECHRIACDTFLSVLRYFRAGQEDGPPLVGVTATPFRSDKQRLANIFDEVVYEKTLRKAIEEGHLVRIRAVRVASETDLSNVRSRRDDFVESELASVVNTDYRNSLLCSAIEQHAADRRSILVFCTGVDHAERTAEQLRDRGHKAECVTGKTDMDERSDILRRFKQGETRIVSNCAVLTEGYDQPSIDAVVMARPTKSRLFYCQAIGRGTRKFLGKTDLKIIDLVDVCGKHHIETASTLFGLREMDLLGEDVLDAVTICEVAEQRGLQVADGDRIDNVSERSAQLELMTKRTISVGTKAEDVDVFAACRLGRDVERESEFPWIRMPNDTYVLPIDGPKRAVLKRDKFGVWGCDVIDKPRGGDAGEMHMRRVHGWTLSGTSNSSVVTGGGASDTTRIGGMNCGKGDTPPFREADKVVKRFAGYRLCDDRPPMPWWKILRQGAKWRRLPATDGQRAALRKWGVRVPDALMRGVASTMLETLRLRREGVWRKD